MSASSLKNSSNYPFIQTEIITTNAVQATNVTFKTPFPTGSLPIVFIQNTEGTVWPNIIFSTQNLSNTGFTIIQTGSNAFEEVLISYLAIWIPTTPPPP